MNKSFAVVACLLAAGVGATIALPRYWQQQQVNHLVQTRSCVGCDLQAANLAGLDLHGVNLEGANLQSANLEGTKLGAANLKDANLERSNLNKADFGCAAVKFNLRADDKNANMDVSVDSQPADPRPNNSSVLGFNLTANEQGATMKLNLWGCADLEHAKLKGARLPNGTVYQ